ncbi:MAG: esterase/lipase family protein [Phycisphaerales bacterium]
MPAAALKPPFFPIVYLRGFAATDREIESTVATPYMGFNLGSTKIRQDHEGNIVRFIFESPLIRLMKDHDYLDVYRNGDFPKPDETVEPRSIWIFRYYEDEDQPGGGRRASIPEFARELREFILQIREQVCRDQPSVVRTAFRVYLVAHSMGGLIVRCYLQNLCRNGWLDERGRVDTEETARLELSDRPVDENGRVDDSVHLVEKVFTYGTPHGGIEMLGVAPPDLGGLDRWHIRNFKPKNIQRYLGLSRKSDIRSLDGAFDPQRFFCFIGTNYRDYSAFFRMSKRVTGPTSDGLVMISNAAVQRAPRAFAHRSHSGPFGIVNSEEGYQNLRRFFFGEWRVDARLFADEITLPLEIQREVDRGRKVEVSYHIEAALRVRGAAYFLHERRMAHASAVFARHTEWVNGDPEYLFSTCLLEAARTKGNMAEDGAKQDEHRYLAFALDLAIVRPMYEVERRFWFDDHFEGAPILAETITFHVNPRAPKRPLRYGLSSARPVGDTNREPAMQLVDDNRYEIDIPLGFEEIASNERKPKPGFRGRLRLTATRRRSPRS